MENFIKEGKGGFDFAAVSSHSKVVNANRMRLHMLAYNLFNWFRRLVLPANMRKQQVDTIRLKLIKIAARAVRSARYITFKLCSSCPYKEEFYRTLKNIQQLTDPFLAEQRSAHAERVLCFCGICRVVSLHDILSLLPSLQT